MKQCLSQFDAAIQDLQQPEKQENHFQLSSPGSKSEPTKPRLEPIMSKWNIVMGVLNVMVSSTISPAKLMS